MALVAKASGKDKAVVAKAGRKWATAMASEIGASVSMLPGGPSSEGGAG